MELIRDPNGEVIGFRIYTIFGLTFWEWWVIFWINVVVYSLTWLYRVMS